MFSDNTDRPRAQRSGARAGEHHNPERRQRRRRPTRVPGWIYFDDAGRDQVHEVQMRNFSAEGAGFLSPIPLRKGQSLHLKVGLGPTRQPRPAEIAYMHRRPDGKCDIGVRFVAQMVAAPDSRRSPALPLEA